MTVRILLTAATTRKSPNRARVQQTQSQSQVTVTVTHSHNHSRPSRSFVTAMPPREPGTRLKLSGDRWGLCTGTRETILEALAWIPGCNAGTGKWDWELEVVTKKLPHFPWVYPPAQNPNNAPVLDKFTAAAVFIDHAQLQFRSSLQGTPPDCPYCRRGGRRSSKVRLHEWSAPCKVVGETSSYITIEPR